MKTHTLFFSPTQTGATVARAVQTAMQSKSGESFDITKRTIEKTFDADDVVIVAMPIYSGRLPSLAAERFQAIQGNGAKAVAIAIYGNANVGDALLELTNICQEQGFEVIAAATFIGEHSFAVKEFPIAAGRPDAKDLQKANTFAQLIEKTLGANTPITPPTVPGIYPYAREANNLPGVAATGYDPETCTGCGLCKVSCPTGAITMTGNGPQTNDSKCIWCAACVKVCTSHARKFILPKIPDVAQRLYTNCQTRKEPQWFLAEPVVENK